MNLSVATAISNCLKATAFAGIIVWLAYGIAVSLRGVVGSEILFSAAILLLIITLKLAILLVIVPRFERLAYPVFGLTIALSLIAQECFHWSISVIIFSGFCLFLLVVGHHYFCNLTSIPD